MTKHPKSLLALALAVRPSAEQKRGLPDPIRDRTGVSHPAWQKAPSSPRLRWTDRQRIGSLSTNIGLLREMPFSAATHFSSRAEI